MSEIKSIHQELIKRCKVIKLTSDEIWRLKYIGKYPRIENDDYPVLCTNISHTKLPSYFCYINGYELRDYIIDVYLPKRYNAKIMSLMDAHKFWNDVNKTWLLEHPEIDDYQEILILDEFIDAIKSLNNKLLRKYLSDNEIVSLNYGQCAVEIKDGKASILKLGK